MLDEFHVTRESYREAIQDEANQGRVPFARLTWGYLAGSGWSFLNPWEQLALFPTKGTLRGLQDPARKHCRFWLRRLVPFQRELKHPRHSFPIAGQYWTGLCWREGWRQPRKCILDSALIDYDLNLRPFDDLALALIDIEFPP